MSIEDTSIKNSGKGGTYPLIYLPKVATVGLVLSLLTGELTAHAQTPPDATTVRLKYVHYQDFQAGGDSRMKATSPMLWVQTPLTTSTILEGSAILDTLSGASPLYLDTLSGASGKGIHDERHAGTLSVTQYFDGYSVGVGGAYSEENDYLSRSGNVQLRAWTDDKNTVFSLGLSGDSDVITSTNNPQLEEGRLTKALYVGVTQVLSQHSIMQSSVTGSYGHGYYTDPYKLFDNRPHTRDALIWLTRYNYFVESLGAAWHSEYRLFADSWGVNAHTFETSLYQPVGERVTVVPLVRYYYQQGASFFDDTIPTDTTSRFNSADQRLMDFGGVSLGTKIIFQLSQGIKLDALYEYMQQSAELGLQGNDRIQDIGAHYFEIGMALTF